MRLELRSEVLWRAYPDGLVVYVGETCETHLLPLAFEDLLKTPQVFEVVAQAGILERPGLALGVHPGPRVSRAYAEELSGLKIFDPLS
ncbi:hypothetical protein [Roseateles koreensis]|uniref:DUF2442 domain-containing protein n=1 Tax=Roseateles koreensis TaxID=2987526 RepID=A0ABT5KPN1_9BURK|nr:hypothetical protein [Roseateles koreensis]MDC8784869.1 hypothetical protein [Roseateles koreensis]